MKNKPILLLLAVTALSIAVRGQNKKDKQAEIKNIVETKNYVFKAQTALPSTGRVQQLTSDFDLRVTRDSIVSYLPYFGRAFTAPVNPSQGPLNFTSTDFQYKSTNRKKGGWEIIIIPKDVQDPRQLALSIFDNGTASLTVTSNNRQPIAFNGYVTARK